MSNDNSITVDTMDDIKKEFEKIYGFDTQLCRTVKAIIDNAYQHGINEGWIRAKSYLVDLLPTGSKIETELGNMVIEQFPEQC